MNKTSAVIKIFRPENVIITFVAVIVGAIISTGIKSLQLNIIWGAVSLAFACAAGNVINDIYDIEIDKINKPNRVLPTGSLSCCTVVNLHSTFRCKWNYITGICFCCKYYFIPV